MMDDALSKELGQLKDAGLFRSLRKVTSVDGSHIVIDGKHLLNFSSNDYLGLANDSRLFAASKDAGAISGFGSGASRLICGNYDVHEALEKELAAFKGTAAAVLFSSGYMANVGAISALVGRDDVVFSDRINHASIVDGIILSRAGLKRYHHNDMASLEEALHKAKGFRRKLVVTDTVFSMDGDVAPLKEIVALAKKYHAWIMADEAHAFGVLGPSGAGLVEELGLNGKVDIEMGTLSKSAGSFGAYVAGSRELIDYLLNHARSFIYTTAMPRPVAAASLAALRIIHDEPWRRDKIMKNAEVLRSGLKKMGFDTKNSVTPIIPVMIGDDKLALECSRLLFKSGIFVSAIRPPTVPKGTARLRLSVSALHSDDNLEQCLKAFKLIKVEQVWKSHC